jgi:hypothetical protein
VVAVHSNPAVAGTPTGLTLVAVNDRGCIKEDFLGSVELETTDPDAAIPGNLEFGGESNGVVVVGGEQLIFRTPGRHEIRVSSSGVSGRLALVVLPDVTSRKCPDRIGDVNGDGELDNGDLEVLDQLIETGIGSDPLLVIIADCNKNGKIDAPDSEVLSALIEAEGGEDVVTDDTPPTLSFLTMSEGDVVPRTTLRIKLAFGDLGCGVDKNSLILCASRPLFNDRSPVSTIIPVGENIARSSIQKEIGDEGAEFVLDGFAPVGPISILALIADKAGNVTCARVSINIAGIQIIPPFPQLATDGGAIVVSHHVPLPGTVPTVQWSLRGTEENRIVEKLLAQSKKEPEIHEVLSELFFPVAEGTIHPKDRSVVCINLKSPTAIDSTATAVEVRSVAELDEHSIVFEDYAALDMQDDKPAVVGVEVGKKEEGRISSVSPVTPELELAARPATVKAQSWQSDLKVEVRLVQGPADVKAVDVIKNKGPADEVTFSFPKEGIYKLEFKVTGDFQKGEGADKKTVPVMVTVTYTIPVEKSNAGERDANSDGLPDQFGSIVLKNMEILDGLANDIKDLKDMLEAIDNFVGGRAELIKRFRFATNPKSPRQGHLDGATTPRPDLTNRKLTMGSIFLSPSGLGESKLIVMIHEFTHVLQIKRFNEFIQTKLTDEVTPDKFIDFIKSLDTDSDTIADDVEKQKHGDLDKEDAETEPTKVETDLGKKMIETLNKKLKDK